MDIFRKALPFSRALFKGLLAAVALLLPAAFADDIKYQHGHPLSWVLRIFGIILIVLTAWEVVEKTRAQTEEKLRAREPKFFAEYSANLTNAIKIVQDLHLYTPQQCDIAIKSLVEIIRSVVAAYGEERLGEKLNVNVMRPFPFSREIVESLGRGLHFYDSEKKDDFYSHILTLTHWADDDHCVPEKFALPVHATRRKLLFGAPRAFVLGETQVIGDINSRNETSKLADDQERGVKEDIRRYLSDRTSFRNFVSIRLAYNGEAVGVLNIQTGKPKVFGEENKMSREMKEYVVPLCQPLFEILGMILATLENSSRQKKGATS